MQGAATQAMPLRIVEERQRSRYASFAAAPLRAAARRPAGFVARSANTAAGMRLARAAPSGLGASSKVYTLFLDGPLDSQIGRLRGELSFSMRNACCGAG